MKWKTTAALGIITVALGFYVSQVELKRPTQERQLQLARQVLQIPRDTVTSLAVTFPNAVVTVTRDHQTWRLTAPVAARADEALVTRILVALDPLDAQGVMENTPRHPLRLSDFGLEAPAATLAIVTAQQTTRLSFGSKTAVGNVYYLARDANPTVFVVGTELYDALNQGVEAYRSRALLDLDTPSVTAITVTSATNPLNLTKAGTAWKLTSPVADEADTAAVALLLSRLRSLRIDRFLSNAPQPADLTKWGLDTAAPFAKIAFGFGQADQKPLDVILGKATPDNAEQLAAKRSDESAVYAVAKSDVDAVLQSPQDLRSRGLFDVFTNQVTKIQVTHAQGSWTAEFTDGKWTAAGAVLASPKVEEWLWKLRDSKLTRFIEDQPKDVKSYGLDPAKATIRVWVKDQADAKELLAGDAIPQQQARYGKMSERACIVELPEGLNDIFNTTLESFKAAPPATPTPASTPAATPATPPSR